MKLALIGGTGIDKLPLQEQRSINVDTPYGPVGMDEGRIGQTKLFFLKRHGLGHAIPPHLVNYRGNIWALKQIGVQKILATGAVGSISRRFKAGDIVLPDQFLDFTKNRIQTFYEGGDLGVLHVDVSEPYCPDLRRSICLAAESMGLRIKDKGVYVCTEGPRFETPAEIKMFRMLGGEFVGMTGVPEVVLARELGICYATIALVTNAAAGISKQPLTHAEVIDTMNMLGETVTDLIIKTCAFVKEEQDCYCRAGGREAGLF